MTDLENAAAAGRAPSNDPRFLMKGRRQHTKKPTLPLVVTQFLSGF